MSRHFTNGFVTEAASNSVLKLGAFVFSVAFAFSTWAWVDEEYNWSTLKSAGGLEQFQVSKQCQLTERRNQIYTLIN